MNKTEFVKEIAQRAEITQKAAKEILDVAQEIVFETMKKEEEVKVFDGVTLVGVHKDATVARNPMDGSAVNVPEKTVPKAKFGAGLKRMLAE